MFNLIVLFNIIIIFLKLCNADTGTYSIIAPKIIRPGEPYTAIIALQDVNKETDVFCTLKQYKLGNNKIDTPVKIQNFTQLNDVKNINFCSININFGLTEGLYEVLFEASGGGITFNTTLNLSYISNQFIILVQTDKAIYKPGQDVMFRVIILNQSLKPINEVEIQGIKIYIMDPLENKLATYISSSIGESGLINTNQFDINEGVTDDLSFNLHQNVLLGNWNIRVVVKEQVQNYNFFVDNYYLPLANVTINFPPFPTFSDNQLKIRVDSFYTFGKPVTGLLKLVISMHKACANNEKSFKDLSISNINITGQVEQSIDISSFLEVKCNLVMLKFTATVEDNYTNSIYEEIDVLKITDTFLTVDHELPPKRFKPGQLVEIKSIIKQQPQKYDKDLMYNLTCRGKITSKTNFVQQTRLLDSPHTENEIICRYFTNNDTVSLKHDLIYNNILLDTLEVKALTNCENITFQIFLKEPRFQIKPNDIIDLVVNATVPFNRIIYYVVVRGSIIETKIQDFEKLSTTQNFNQKIVSNMVPEATFVVYYATKHGYLASDQLTIKVVGLLNRNVKINVTTPVLNAGNRANFTLESNEDSTVYLLAVDESILALKQGNDIFEARVLQQLLDLPQVEEANGLYYKTNGGYECGNSEFYSLHSDSVVENKNPDKVIRQDLRETWIWDKVLMGKRKKVNLWDNVPDSITSWKITAFSIHKFEGLSLIEDPGYVTVYRPFFLKLNLPFKMRSQETAEIHILLFSYLNETSSISLDVFADKKENIKFINCTKLFSLEANEIKQITCSLSSTKKDTYTITAVANATDIKSNKVYSDGEEKELSVTFEGREVSVEKPVLFEVDDTEPVIDESKIVIPYGFVDESLRVFITATPQLISNATQVSLIKTLDTSKFDPYFQKPHGCCEQRAAEFFPMVYLLDYLNNTKQLKLEDEIKAIESINTHISYLCFHNPNDGSFVSFDYHNVEFDFDKYPNMVSKNILSSVWQTANVLKLLYYARKYVNVESKIIDNALIWLNGIQNSDGGFVEIETTTIFSTKNKDAYLTSFVYIAMDLYKMPNQKSLAYLERNFDRYYNSLDTLDIIITCYVFHLSKSPLQESCFEKVLRLSVFTSEKNTTTWLGSDDKKTSAYALMLFSNRKSKVLGLQVFKKLIAMRKSRGDFGDTHSTALCTEALSMFVSQLKHYDSSEENVKIEFNYKSGNKTLQVSPKYGNIQADEINNNTYTVNLRATGKGRAIASVIWIFNVKSIPGSDFDVLSWINYTNNGPMFMNFCTRYNLNGTATNVITEIDLPTGFKFSGGLFKDNDNSYQLARFESTNDQTHINLYINQLKEDKLCLKVGIIETHKVANLSPGSITVSNYYHLQNPTMQQFKPNET